MTKQQKISADPWRDLDVIDKRAVRFSQGITSLMALLGIFISPLFCLAMGVQLLLGLLLGRKWCIPCLLYYHYIQPRLGEGQLEDSRPPRFANIIGATFLLGSFVCFVLDIGTLGVILAATVAFLAAVASLANVCLGCLLYRLLAHLRGIRSWQGSQVDLADFQAPGVVLFSHPLCLECQEWKERIPDAQIIDVSQEKELAQKYGILLVPTVYEIKSDGVITKQLAP